MKVVGAMCWVFVVMPIWLYLLYQILERVNASDVMWLLYWVYLPVGLFVAITQKLAELEKR
jgi:hypothetical protein